MKTWWSYMQLMSRVRLRWMFMINGKSLRERRREWEVCDFPKGRCQINHVLVTLLHGLLWNSLVLPLHWNNKSGRRSETLEMPLCFPSLYAHEASLWTSPVGCYCLIDVYCLEEVIMEDETILFGHYWACQQTLLVQRWENVNSRSDKIIFTLGPAPFLHL